MYHGYTTWDYINNRVMTLNPCFTELPQDYATTFTWNPNRLLISANGQNYEFHFQLDELHFIPGENPHIQAPYPISEYINRIKSASYLDLISNVINLMPSNQPGGKILLSLANK